MLDAWAVRPYCMVSKTLHAVCFMAAYYKQCTGSLPGGTAIQSCSCMKNNRSVVPAAVHEAVHRSRLQFKQASPPSCTAAAVSFSLLYMTTAVSQVEVLGV